MSAVLAEFGPNATTFVYPAEIFLVRSAAGRRPRLGYTRDIDRGAICRDAHDMRSIDQSVFVGIGRLVVGVIAIGHDEAGAGAGQRM